MSAAQETTHEITVDAAPGAVYELIADVRRWPVVFPPTVHAERIGGTDSDERIQIWATANGALRRWTSSRVLDPARRRISFRQDSPAHPVAEMSGEWIVESLPGNRTRVVLLHWFHAVSDEAESVGWLHKAVDRNSTSELHALRVEVERGDDGGIFQFEDSVHTTGSAADVYDFLYRSDLWAARLDHVAAIAVEEDEPGLQHMEMDTRAPDGAVHSTRSVRVCRPDSEIVYKQLSMPPLLRQHTGKWGIAREAAGLVVTSQHVVAVAPEAVREVLGKDRTLADARTLVRDALSRNSLLTLNAAKAYAEGQRAQAR